MRVVVDVGECSEVLGRGICRGDVERGLYLAERGRNGC